MRLAVSDSPWNRVGNAFFASTGHRCGGSTSLTATSTSSSWGIFDYWIEKRAPRKRNKKDDESIIRKHLRPAFGAMKLRNIGVQEVDGYINVKIDDEELSDKTVNNHVTLLSTMLRTATTFKVPWLLGVGRRAQRTRGLALLLLELAD